jgi:hypothetical protein
LYTRKTLFFKRVLIRVTELEFRLRTVGIVSSRPPLVSFTRKLKLAVRRRRTSADPAPNPKIGGSGNATTAIPDADQDLGIPLNSDFSTSSNFVIWTSPLVINASPPLLGGHS